MASESNLNTLIGILTRLDKGAGSAVGELADLISRSLTTTVEVKETTQTTATLHFSLDDVRLRNFDNIFMLLTFSSSAKQTDLSEWKTRMAGTDRFVIVVMSSNSAHPSHEATFPPSQGYLTLSTARLAALIRSKDPRVALKQAAAAAISAHRLNPFSIVNSTPANMFVGRAREIEMLAHDVTASFAIAGPGRIGKSSLLRQYRQYVRTCDPPRVGRLVFLDFFYEENLDDDALSRTIAMRINPSKRASETNLSSLRSFLQNEARIRNGPIELLMDEVDRICWTRTFGHLAQMSRDNVCRLIVCGRGDLFHALYDPRHPLHARARAVRLPPLTREETQRLFLQPLVDMGFQFREPLQSAELVFEYTRGYPHLIQYLGGEVVDVVLREDIRIIDNALLMRICSSYETALFFLSPLLDLKDDLTAFVALTLVMQPRDSFSEIDVAQLIHDQGRTDIDQLTVNGICRELYIENVLSWNGKHYAIANPMIARSARQLGHLAPRLRELQARVTVHR